MKIKILTVALLTLFAASAHSATISGNWNEDSKDEVNRWISGLSNSPKKYLVVFDCDNTTWAGDIADFVFEFAVNEGKISWETTSPIPNFDRKENETPFEYYERLGEFDIPTSYNYVAQAFSGLTLSEIQSIFDKASRLKGFPKTYKEILAVSNALAKKGVASGFISASPLFLVAPMIEKSKLPAPLSQIEGIDIMVETPNGKRFLGDVIHSDGKIKNWSDALKKYGSLKIYGSPGIASPEINAQRGKSIAVVAIARRLVMKRVASGDRSTPLSEMMLAGVFGDNFAPFSDMPHAESARVGNDQGLALGLPLMRGALILNIYRTAIKGDKIDYDVKRGNHIRFQKFAEQLRALEPSLIFAEQLAVYKGHQIGFISNKILDPMKKQQTALK